MGTCEGLDSRWYKRWNNCQYSSLGFLTIGKQFYGYYYAIIYPKTLYNPILSIKAQKLCSQEYSLNYIKDPSRFPRDTSQFKRLEVSGYGG